MSPPVPRHGGSRLSRYRAERLLRKDFAGLRTKVLAIVRGQLRAKGIALDPADLEACYAQAWHGLYATVLEGEQVENPSAWLVLVTFRRAIDEHRAAARAGVVGLEEIGSYPSRLDAARTDLASEFDDRARLRQVFEALRTRLSARECEAASLCYLQGLSRAEAAERMGVSAARMRKLMEGTGAGRAGVAGKVGELLETIEAGGWCEQQTSLMRAYAFGILDPDGERHALAASHCRECPACRAHVATLRGLASVLPLPLLPPLAGAGAGAATGAHGASRLGGSGVSGTRATAGTSGKATVGTETQAVASTSGRAAAGARTGAVGAAANASRFGVGGWSGIAGSLTTKLAVTAVVVVGAGYAALGSHAHASPSGRPAHAAPAPIAVSALSPAPFALSSVSTLTGPPFAWGQASAHGPRSKRRPRAAARRHARSAQAHGESSVEAAAREFGPERASGVAPAQSAASTQARAPGSEAGEFGLE
jgi:RNA polymerase sigma factor (sigma-70 family)